MILNIGKLRATAVIRCIFTLRKCIISQKKSRYIPLRRADLMAVNKFLEISSQGFFFSKISECFFQVFFYLKGKGFRSIEFFFLSDFF
jgi:hypothetical protein